MAEEVVGETPADVDAQQDGATAGPQDAELVQITGEESKVLARVHRSLDARQFDRTGGADYDKQLIELRDQINEARLEDVPPLIEEMERLQGVAARRAQVTEGVVDRASPYFGRLVLEENERKREVLIGRATYLDPKTGTRIVDWRDAPVSRIYYRYEEGDDYEENFGGRDVEGDVLVRRSISVVAGKLKRVGSPQGTFVCTSDERWVRLDDGAARLAGGQGAAMRAEKHHKPGKLGIGNANAAGGRDDKHLPEIAALIDPRQFELITKPSAGLVVIQGGAGSGKTTIGLHRLAYLAFQDKQRFQSDKMLVIVFNDALARYISRVLPALGVPDVLVTTYDRWAHRMRSQHLQGLPKQYDEDTPTSATRLKKHPALLKLIDERVADLSERCERIVGKAIREVGRSEPQKAWRESDGLPPAGRLRLLRRWLKDRKGAAKHLDVGARHAIERAIQDARRHVSDVLSVWADILTDREAIHEALEAYAPGEFSAADLDEAMSWTRRRCPAIVAYRDMELDGGPGQDESDRERRVGIDGNEELDQVGLDLEDNTLLLRLVQRLRGALSRKGEPMVYEHIFIDEAQDMSPVELTVVLETASRRKSVTLAGDIAQRLHMYNGFSDWRQVLRDLGMAQVNIEPLKLSYRSTHEIIEFATDILGPLKDEETGKATRHGAPVELFRFGHSGDAVAFLGEALRDLMTSEPRASVAVIARYPEQADVYFRGLKTAEVPYLRRIAEQDFPFKPGVDVTDVRQVKGLEFDYVVLVEASTASYGTDDEARHLMHIAATRAAHQLWVTTTGAPSIILPRELVKRAL